MGSQNVPRETKQIITKDFLVSNKEFVVEEIEKGVLETRPKISDTEISKYYNSKEYLSHKKGTSFFSSVYSFASKFMLKRKAKLKDTGNLLPGHGGFLYIVDGKIFALPASTILLLISTPDTSIPSLANNTEVGKPI